MTHMATPFFILPLLEAFNNSVDAIAVAAVELALLKSFKCSVDNDASLRHRRSLQFRCTTSSKRCRCFYFWNGWCGFQVAQCSGSVCKQTPVHSNETLVKHCVFVTVVYWLHCWPGDRKGLRRKQAINSVMKLLAV